MVYPFQCQIDVWLFFQIDCVLASANIYFLLSFFFCDYSSDSPVVVLDFSIKAGTFVNTFEDKFEKGSLAIFTVTNEIGLPVELQTTDQ